MLGLTLLTTSGFVWFADCRLPSKTVSRTSFWSDDVPLGLSSA